MISSRNGPPLPSPNSSASRRRNAASGFRTHRLAGIGAPRRQNGVGISHEILSSDPRCARQQMAAELSFAFSLFRSAHARFGPGQTAPPVCGKMPDPRPLWVSQRFQLLWSRPDRRRDRGRQSYCLPFGGRITRGPSPTARQFLSGRHDICSKPRSISRLLCWTNAEALVGKCGVTY
jgi:hypothetical protein